MLPDPSTLGLTWFHRLKAFGSGMIVIIVVVVVVMIIITIIIIIGVVVVIILHNLPC
jgi:hypothetical protein